MIVESVAQKFVDGLYDEVNGLGVHDAVHVLATKFGLSKPEVRAAIYGLYRTEIVEETPAVEEPVGEINEYFND